MSQPLLPPQRDPVVRGAHALQFFQMRVEARKESLRLAIARLVACGNEQHYYRCRERPKRGQPMTHHQWFRRPERQHEVDCPKGRHGWRMKQECHGSRHPCAQITLVRDQPDSQKNERHDKPAGYRLVFEDEHGRTHDGCTEREHRRDDERRQVGEPQRSGNQIDAPDSQRPENKLLGLQHVAKIQAGDSPQRDGRLVIKRERHVRMFRDQVFLQHRGVRHMLQNRHVDLRVGLQPGTAGELEKVQQRDPEDR